MLFEFNCFMQCNCYLQSKPSCSKMSCEFRCNELYNLSVGVTPEEVDLATQQEVLIVQAKRRKVIKKCRSSSGRLLSSVEDLSNCEFPFRNSIEVNIGEEGGGDFRENKGHKSKKNRNSGSNRHYSRKRRKQSKDEGRGKGNNKEDDDDLSSPGGQGSGAPGDGGKDEDTDNDWDGDDDDTESNVSEATTTGTGTESADSQSTALKRIRRTFGTATAVTKFRKKKRKKIDRDLKNTEQKQSLTSDSESVSVAGKKSKHKKAHKKIIENPEKKIARNSNVSDLSDSSSIPFDDDKSVISESESVLKKKHGKNKKSKRKKVKKIVGTPPGNKIQRSDLNVEEQNLSLSSISSDEESQSVISESTKHRRGNKSKKKKARQLFETSTEEDSMFNNLNSFSNLENDITTSSEASSLKPLSKAVRIDAPRKRRRIKKKKDKGAKGVKSELSLAKSITSTRSKRSKKGRKKGGGRRAAPEEYFSDGEISSDSDFDKSDSPSDEDERDIEWLVGEDHDGRDFLQAERPSEYLLGTPEITKGVGGKEATERLMACLMPLFLLMRWIGRMPFQMVKNGSGVQFVFDRKQRDFNIFCVSSIVLTASCIALMSNVNYILHMHNPKILYEEILSTELEKYWVEALLTCVSLFVTCAWSIVIMFEGGLHLSEYLNRWNCAVAILKYDVSYGLKSFVRCFLIGYSIYSVIFILLFFLGGEIIPTVREASGFIVLLVVHSFLNQIRLNPLYFLLEYIGLVFHLYTVLCGGLILMMVMTYALALKNAAMRFNLRLALALRKVALPEGDKLWMRVSRLIPFEKLWGEHVLLTTMSRHTGAVFAVVLNAFYLTKMFTMVGTLYGITKPIQTGYPEFNETFFNLSTPQHKTDENETLMEEEEKRMKRSEAVVPIRHADPENIIMLKGILFLIYCWGTFFLLSEVLHKTGLMTMNGLEYARRHGQVLSKSLNESRFVLSLQNSAAPNRSYFINPGTEINRQFILGFVTFVIVVLLLLLQLNPHQLATSTKIICNEAGECVEVVYPRSWKISTPKQITTPRTTPHTTTSTTTTTTTTVRPITQTPKPWRVEFTPCDPKGALPVEIRDFAYTCPGYPFPRTYFPTVFTKSPSGKYYDPVQPNCKTLEVSTTATVYDCFGEEVKSVKKDECKMIELSTPGKDGQASKPSLELVIISGKSETPKTFCCFNYSQLESQVGRCNLPPEISPSSVCAQKAQTNRRNYDRFLWRKIKALDIQMPEQNADLNWPVWSDCICQDKDDAVCQSLLKDSDYPPCEDKFLKIDHAEDQFKPGSCPWNVFKGLEKGLKMQILFQRDKYFQYYPIIPNGECGSSSKYSDTMDLNKFRNTSVVITNCYGNVSTAATVGEVLLDDCQNVKIDGVAELGQPEMKLVYKRANEIRGVTKDSVYCCFTWPNRKSPSLTCNLESSEVPKRCGKGDPSPERQFKETFFWQALDEKGGKLPDDEMETWKDCICRGVGGYPAISGACGKLIPTTVPPKPAAADCDKSVQIFKETMTKECDKTTGAEYSLIGFFTNGNYDVVHKIAHCEAGGGGVNLENGLENPSNGTVEDCYGNSFDHKQFKDDCGMYKLKTPDSRNVGQDPELRKVVFPGGGGQFLCCWKYEAFPTGHIRCNLNNIYRNNYNNICAVRKMGGCGNVHNANNINTHYELKCTNSKQTDGIGVTGKKICTP